MEFRACRIELKASLEKRTIFGFASTFEEPENHDSYGDVFAPGAWVDTIASNGPKGTGRIKALWQHDQRTPLGRLAVLEEQKAGLYYETEPLVKTRAADEALELITARVVEENSVGFDTLAHETVDEVMTRWGFPVRRITKAKLYEVSPVTIAANEGARIQGLKHWHQTASGVFVPMDRVKALAHGLAVSLDTLLGHLADGEPLELKAGKVLSSKNLDRLIAARDSINTVIEAAQASGDDKDDDDGDEAKAAVTDFKAFCDKLATK